MKLRMGVVALAAVLGVALVALPATAGIKMNIGSTYGPDAPVQVPVSGKFLVGGRT